MNVRLGNHRALPTVGQVLRAQFALIGAARKRGAWIAFGYILLQSVILASSGVILGIAVSTHGGATTVALGTSVADLADMRGPLDEGRVALFFAAIAFCLWAVLWPFKVWRGERPSKRGYHRAMPVERSTHDLIRVVAGAIWLLAIEAVVIVAAALAAVVAGHASGLVALHPVTWLQILLAPLIPYLAISAVVVGTERWEAWILGAAGGFALAYTLIGLVWPDPVTRFTTGLLVGDAGLISVLGGPIWRQTFAETVPAAGTWALGWLLWFGIALAGLTVAAGLLGPSRRRRE